MSLDITLSVVKLVEVDVFDWNITHNLGRMADAAGLYQVMWRPEEQGWTKAGELIPALTAGIQRLTEEPAKFRTMNPENAWGTYEGLLAAATEYLDACQKYPDATIRVGR